MMVWLGARSWRCQTGAPQQPIGPQRGGGHGRDVNARAYNSLSQYRADAWSSLEEASERVSAAAAAGRPLDGLVERVNALLDQLGPIERYWAYPGLQAYQQGRRLFAAGKYTRFARAVASLNRGLVTDSYRNGAAWSVATAIQEPLRSGHRGGHRRPG